VSHPVLTNTEERMNKTIQAFAHELSGVRAGRASPALVDGVTVEAYGSPTPLKQIANISIPEPRQIVIAPWDKGMVRAIERAVNDAGLGVNAMADGDVVRVPLPDLTEERRKELVKVVRKYAEHAKVAVRNLRRDGNDQLKKLEKDKELSADDVHKLTDEVQKLTDRMIAKVDEMTATKEKDILAV